MTKRDEPPPPVVRTSAGVRDLLFDEIDFIRRGSSNATRANAVAKLAMVTVETVRMELEVAKFVASPDSKVAQPPVGQLPKPLNLGGAEAEACA